MRENSRVDASSEDTIDYMTKKEFQLEDGALLQPVTQVPMGLLVYPPNCIAIAHFESSEFLCLSVQPVRKSLNNLNGKLSLC